MELKLRLTRRRAVVLVALIAAIGAGVAYAAIPDGNKVFAACMLKNVGTIRLIDPSLPSSSLMSHCNASLETQVSWNQQGQPGTPGKDGINGKDGTNGTNGTNGTDGTDGTDGHDGVSVTSAAEPAGANCANGGSKLTAVDGVSYVCNGADGEDGAGSNGAPWDITPTTIGVMNPGETRIVVVPCPTGDVILGGTFTEGAPFRTVVTSQQISNTAWQYTVDNTNLLATTIGPLTTLTYCGKP